MNVGIQYLAIEGQARVDLDDRRDILSRIRVQVVKSNIMAAKEYARWYAGNDKKDSVVQSPRPVDRDLQMAQRSLQPLHANEAKVLWGKLPGFAPISLTVHFLSSHGNPRIGRTPSHQSFHRRSGVRTERKHAYLGSTKNTTLCSGVLRKGSADFLCSPSPVGSRCRER
jgi:hypothetical protein